MAQKAKELQETSGSFSCPLRKTKSDRLSEEVMNNVREFYHQDSISRMMPGKGDCVSVRKDGAKVKVQKRLLLCNLKEAYVVFKSEYPSMKVGFSKFAELRPKNVVLPGSAGTHAVCVCTYHQNVKLMICN